MHKDSDVWYKLKLFLSKIKYSAKKLLRWFEDESLATASYSKTRKNEQIFVFKTDDKRTTI